MNGILPSRIRVCIYYLYTFSSYDKESGILFSRYLFGGLTEEFSLYAKSVDDYFEVAKVFHKYYMLSKEVLTYFMTGTK